MLVVVALGGNAIAVRGAPMTVSSQRLAIAEACVPLAGIAGRHGLVVSHGNGPQVGLLALQAASYDEESAYPFDVLGAQTEGMIGYLIEQELDNALGHRRSIATLVTRTLVDAADVAFHHPTKPIGPVYAPSTATELAAEHGWDLAEDGAGMRRVVPSPAPLQILEIEPIRWMVRHGGVVICAGGGGVPTAVDPTTRLRRGVEAVIDKDLASAVLARDLGADALVIATDVDGVCTDWGGPDQRLITRAHPDALDAADYPPGSMGPKVQAAAQFARETGGRAVIGSLHDIDSLLTGAAGTTVTDDAVGVSYRTA